MGLTQTFQCGLAGMADIFVQVDDFSYLQREIMSSLHLVELPIDNDEEPHPDREDRSLDIENQEEDGEDIVVYARDKNEEIQTDADITGEGTFATEPEAEFGPDSVEQEEGDVACASKNTSVQTYPDLADEGVSASIPEASVGSSNVQQGDNIAYARGENELVQTYLDIPSEDSDIPCEDLDIIDEDPNIPSKGASARHHEVGVGSNSVDADDGDNFFDALPNEIMHYIFSFLSEKELCQVSLVCKQWHMYANDPNFWLKLDFRNKTMNVSEVCQVIERMEYLKEVQLTGLETISDGDIREIVSACPMSVKSLDIGFLRDLGRDTILAINEYLPSIEKLNMEGSTALNSNSITALIKLKSLTDLNISHCAGIEDFHVQTIISNLPLLEIVNIDGLADVSDTTVQKLWQHCGTWLKHLYVDGAGLTDTSMEYVSRCTELQTFSLSFGDNLTDTGLAHVMSLKKLTNLKLRKCSGFSTEVIAEQFIENKALSKLRIFDMSECIDLNDIVVFAMTQRCPNLRELTLGWCWDISDAGVEAIVDSCPSMTQLDLTGLDKIKGDAFQNLPEKMPKLVRLNLGQCNQINDDLMCDVVAKMPDLVAYNYYGLRFGEPMNELS